MQISSLQGQDPPAEPPAVCVSLKPLIHTGDSHTLSLKVFDQDFF